MFLNETKICEILHITREKPLTKCGGFKNELFFLYCTEWVKFSVNWPQTCCLVSYYRSPASMLGHVTTMKTANLYLTDTTPQKLISLLPQYYRILYNMSRTRLGLTVEARLLISLATTSDFCSSYILTPLWATVWVNTSFMENQLKTAL